MGTVINTNIQALNSQRALKVVSGKTEKASERLSSGLRINRAGDDAAGLAISEKMRNQIKGLNQASRNSQDGISLIQTAEGALQETHEMLKRMRELIVQASNDSNTKSDREKISLELNQLTDEIDATADKTEFNSKKLIDGSWNQNELYLHVGANTDQKIEFNIKGMDSVSLGVTKEAVGNVVASGTPNLVTKFNLSKDPVTSSAEFGVQSTKDGGSVSISEKGIVTVKDAAGKSTFYSVSGAGDGSSINKASNLENLGTIEMADGSKVSFDSATKSISLEAKAPETGTQQVSLSDLDGLKLNSGGTISVKDNLVSFSGITSKAIDATSGKRVATGNYPLQDLEFNATVNGYDTNFKFADNGNDITVTTSNPVGKGEVYKLADENGLYYADLKYDGNEGKWITVPLTPENGDKFVDSEGNSLIGKASGTSAANSGYTLSFDGNGNASASVTFDGFAAGTVPLNTDTAIKNLINGKSFTLDGDNNTNPSSISIDTSNGKVTILKNDGNLTDASGSVYDNVDQIKGLTFTDSTTGVKLSFDDTGKLTVSQTVGDLSKFDVAFKKEYEGLTIDTDDYSGTFKINLGSATAAPTFSDTSKVTPKVSEFTGGDVSLYQESTTRNNPIANGTVFDDANADLISAGTYYSDDAKVSLTFDESGDVTASLVGKLANAAAGSADLKALLTDLVFTWDENSGSTIKFNNAGQITDIVNGASDEFGADANTQTLNTNDAKLAFLKGKTLTNAANGITISFDKTTGAMSVSQTKADIATIAKAFAGVFEVEIDESNENATYYGKFDIKLDATDGSVKMEDASKLLDKPDAAIEATFADDMTSYATTATTNVSGLDGDSFDAIDADGNRLYTASFSSTGVTFTNIADKVDDKTLFDAGLVNDTKYSVDDIAQKLDGKTLIDENGIEYAISTGKDDAGNTTIAVEKSADIAELEKSTGKNISDVLKVVDAAIEKVSTQRAELGAVQNRLEYTIKNLDTSSENLSSSESRIRDTDMAKEMMEFTKSNVLSQAAQSMLAQANQAPNNVLSLLR